MKLRTIPTVLVFALSITSCDKSDTPIEKSEENVESAPLSASKHEGFANEISDAMKEFTFAVAEVVDLETANQAAAKIDVIGDRFSGIADALKLLDQPSQEVKVRINEIMETRDAEMQKLMGEELQKTMQALNPEARQVLQKAMGEFFGKMDHAAPEFERHFSLEEGKEDPFLQQSKELPPSVEWNREIECVNDTDVRILIEANGAMGVTILSDAARKALFAGDSGTFKKVGVHLTEDVDSIFDKTLNLPKGLHWVIIENQSDESMEVLL